MITPKTPKRRPNNQKSKGNKYERDTAKKLSIWMFSDPTILYKHEDSGARKIVYNGDITPKHISKYPWDIFPFVIECKNGYKNNIPTLMNQNHLKKWLKKLLEERTDEQRIPVFIAQYHHQIPILMTTIILRHGYMLALVVNTKNSSEFFYVYKFNDLLKRDFLSVMPDWFEGVIKKDVNQEINTQKDESKINDSISTEDVALEIALSNKNNNEAIDPVLDDKPLSKKEQNKIMGEIIVDILGFTDEE